MEGVSQERPVYGGEMKERADDVLRSADNGHKQGVTLRFVSGARQRWRAVAVVAADARQGRWCWRSSLTGYEASIRGDDTGAGEWKIALATTPPLMLAPLALSL